MQEAELGRFGISHQRCSFKKVILKNVSKFSGKHLCQSLFSEKFWEVFKNTFFTEHLRTTTSNTWHFRFHLLSLHNQFLAGENTIEKILEKEKTSYKHLEVWNIDFWISADKDKVLFEFFKVFEKCKKVMIEGDERILEK